MKTLLTIIAIITITFTTAHAGVINYQDEGITTTTAQGGLLIINTDSGIIMQQQ